MKISKVNIQKTYSVELSNLGSTQKITVEVNSTFFDSSIQIPEFPLLPFV